MRHLPEARPCTRGQGYTANEWAAPSEQRALVSPENTSCYRNLLPQRTASSLARKALRPTSRHKQMCRAEALAQSLAPHGGGGCVTTAGLTPSSLSLSTCGESQAEPGPSPTRRVKASVLVLGPPFPNAHSGVTSLMHVKKPVKSFALCPWPKDKPLETTE